MTLELWQEATKPLFYGNIRYKPVGEYVPPVEVPEAAAYPEPVPSTAAPAAADTSSEEEEEEALQLIISEEEKEGWTGVAAAIVRSTTANIEAAIARSTIVGMQPPPSSRSRVGGRGVRQV